SVIDCLMKADSGMLSFCASPETALSRSGPIVPVAPAALSVWQLPQPFDAKTALPAFASPVAPLELPPLAPPGVDAGADEAGVDRAAVDTAGFSPTLLALSVELPVATMTTTIRAIPAAVPSRIAIKTFSMAPGLYPASRRYTASRGCHPRRRTPRWSDDARQTRHTEPDVLRAGDRDQRSVAVRLPRAHAERPGMQAGRAPARARRPPPGRPRRLTHGGCVTQRRWECQRCNERLLGDRAGQLSAHPRATASRPPT